MGTSNLFVNTKDIYQTSVAELVQRKRQKRFNPGAKGSNLSLTVGRILSTIQPLPDHAVLLGRCSDGLPLLLTLSDPDIGAILIGGDGDCGKTHHLQVMVDSAIRTHLSKDLQIIILTHHPEDWQYLIQQSQKRKYIQALHAWYDPGAESTLKSLLSLAESRRDGMEEGPKVVLLLDDLNFIESLSFEAQANLHWLLAYGAQSGVWLIGTIKTKMAPRYRYWMELFRTRIIGRVLSKGELADLTLINGQQMKPLEPSEFRVWTGKDWLTYQIPLLGN